MDGFKTARVLVLDDDPDQAIPVIQALGLLGIGAIYNDGSADAVYEEKLTGIRVMFVDMVLANHGADVNDPEGCARMVAGALSRLVEDSCDPVVVVCWTGHENMTAEFQAVLRKTFPKAKLDDVIVAEKSDYSQPGDLEKLKNVIFDALVAQNPVNVLFHWEQIVHNAATQTTSEITRLMREAECGDKSWSQCGYAICAALVVAERGSRLLDESDSRSLKALFDALNPLLSDRLEHASVPDTPELNSLAKKLKETAVEELSLWPKKSLLTSQLRAALNTMVHLSPNVTKGELCPGDIFLIDEENAKVAGDTLPDWEDVRKDTLKADDSGSFGHVVPLLMEVSATCDFAQAKSRLPRFVAGFFVPEAELKLFRTSAYTRKLGPLFLGGDETMKLDGVFYLVFNTHFLVSVKRDVATMFAPARRLRTPILSDFLAWISGHMSRPGPLHIGP